MSRNEFLLRQLEPPKHPADAVMDTDAFNEIDDQYAIAYLLRSGDKLHTKALYAAPFHNGHSNSPEDGMEKSYDEIIKVASMCGREDLKPQIFKGSRNYLPDEKTPVFSPASEDLAARAMQYGADNPLYVLTIGAITNVASALLINPAIADRIVVVWLGGNAHHMPNWPEFNMMQDIAASRVVFCCGVPLVQLPCMGVVSHLTVTEPELRHHLKGKGTISDYLYRVTCAEVRDPDGNSPMAWSRVIWDVSTVAWALGGGFVADRLIPAPLPSYDHGYIHSGDRHFMRYAFWVNRDAIFEDIFKKLAG